MTSEVTCSGCRQTVPWPASSVRTDVLWLDTTGKARRVTMTDLTSDRVFHRCPPPGRVAGGSDGAWWGEPLADLIPHWLRWDRPSYLDRRGD